MKVLIIPSWFSNSYQPLSGSFFLEQGVALKEAGLEVAFLSVSLISPKLILAQKKLELIGNGYNDYHGIPHFYSQLPSVRPINKKLILHFGKKLFESYRKEFGLPDVVHLHSFLAGDLALWIKKEFGIGYVVTEHSSQIRKLTGDHKKKLDIKNTYSNANSVVAVSHNLAKDIFFKTNVKARVIPNLFKFEGRKLKELNERKSLNVLFVGSLDSNKNPLIILDAIKMMGMGALNVDIIGDGPLYGKLKSRIAALGLQEQVNLCGQLSRTETFKKFEQSDLLLHTSHYETFGMIYIEALAHGIPIISCDSLGVRDIINDKNGILVESNPESIATGLVRIHKDLLNRKYIPQEIRQDAESKFSDCVVARLLISWYKEVYDFK
ncbi:glycosyltransferase [Vibrio profundi]|uniref:glycosyltransferase n=1 Tax=Vibrio profundi TaxID=1774960 RepID=UPI003736C167